MLYCFQSSTSSWLFSKRSDSWKADVLNKTQFGLLLLFALTALVLVLVNVGLFYTNQDLSETVAGRQQYLQQSDQLLQVYRPMINSLAELANKGNDSQIRDLLASQGITFNANPEIHK
jgi:hypothetical protein